MAIDTKSLTELITEFRALQSKNAVSPESLGYLMQRIVDALATAGTSETVSKIQKLLDGFKAAGQAITALSQGQADRNHIYADKTTVDFATGAVSSSSDIFIQQATTERAGAMRAQQVIDLNAAKKGVTELETRMTEIENLVSELDSIVSEIPPPSSPLTCDSHISVAVEDRYLKVRGISALVADGCVPYLFRFTRKRGQFHHKVKKPEDAGRKYCPLRKGWNLWGSVHSVQVTNGLVKFSQNPKSQLSKPAVSYDMYPDILV